MFSCGILKIVIKGNGDNDMKMYREFLLRRISFRFFIKSPSLDVFEQQKRFKSRPSTQEQYLCHERVLP